MKKLLLIILFAIFPLAIQAAPPVEDAEPEPFKVEKPEKPEKAPNIDLEKFRLPEEFSDVDLNDLNLPDPEMWADIEKSLERLNKRYIGIEQVLLKLEEGNKIVDLLIGGDSIVIELDSDSIYIFHYTNSFTDHPTGEDLVKIGRLIVVEEDEIIEGDIVSMFGDVIIKGTVEGSVIAYSGDINVTSTGYVEESVLAISGKVKKEPGATIGGVRWDTDQGEHTNIKGGSSYWMFGFVFILIFIVVFMLSATSASLLKPNIKMVIDTIHGYGYFKSFLLGYLGFFLAFVAFIAFAITLIGLPAAVLGIPIILIGAAILSSTAINNIIGMKILNRNDFDFKTFYYGSLIVSGLPGFLFLVQFLSGSFVLMVLSWIAIGIFIFIVAPIGMGAVILTRFGTKPRESLQKKEVIAKE